MRMLGLIFRLLRRALRRLRPRASGRPRADAPVPGTAFFDARRQRSIPYRVYTPENLPGPAPVVVFSHGLGGSCDAAPYLGRALAAAGYWGVFIQHPGSDRQILDGATSRDEARNRLKSAMRDPTATRDRFLDLHFVLDQLDSANTAQGGPFQGKLDMNRVAMAGHSFGARSVLAAAGQRVGPRRGFKDGRVVAGIALSPSSTRRPGEGEGRNAAAEFAGIDIPVLHVTGTRDAQGMTSDETVDIAHRLRPFQLIQAPGQYLLVLDGARHGDMVADDGEAEDGGRYRQVISMAALLFLDAHLRGNAAARDALRGDFARRLSPGDRFTWK